MPSEVPLTSAGSPRKPASRTSSNNKEGTTAAAAHLPLADKTYSKILPTVWPSALPMHDTFVVLSVGNTTVQFALCYNQTETSRPTIVTK